MLIAIPRSFLAKEKINKAFVTTHVTYKDHNGLLYDHVAVPGSYAGTDSWHVEHFYLIENPTELEIILWGIDASLSSSCE